MNQGWKRRQENITIKPEDGWVLLIVQLNEGQTVESTDAGYGYIAGIATVAAEADSEKGYNLHVDGAFYMYDLRVWASDPTTILKPEQ